MTDGTVLQSSYRLPCYVTASVIRLCMDHSSHANYHNDFCGLESCYHQHMHFHHSALKDLGCFPSCCHFWLIEECTNSMQCLGGAGLRNVFQWSPLGRGVSWGPAIAVIIRTNEGHQRGLRASSHRNNKSCAFKVWQRCISIEKINKCIELLHHLYHLLVQVRYYLQFSPRPHIQGYGPLPS